MSHNSVYILAIPCLLLLLSALRARNNGLRHPAHAAYWKPVSMLTSAIGAAGLVALLIHAFR